MTLTMGAWLTTLDAFEHHLDVQAQLILDERFEDVAAFEPPPHLPALPLALLDRVRELLGRAQALTARGQVIRDETMKRLAQPRHLAFARRPASAYVDQRA